MGIFVKVSHTGWDYKPYLKNIKQAVLEIMEDDQGQASFN